MNNPRDKYRIWDEVKRDYVSSRVFINHHGETCLIRTGCFYPNKVTKEHCTGLRDKNGKLIYEGDILQCIDTKLIVCFNPKIAAFVFVRDFDIELCCGLDRAITMRNAMSTDGAKYIIKYYEVIGNIHEMDVDK